MPEIRTLAAIDGYLTAHSAAEVVVVGLTRWVRYEVIWRRKKWKIFWMVASSAHRRGGRHTTQPAKKSPPDARLWVGTKSSSIPLALSFNSDLGVFRDRLIQIGSRIGIRGEGMPEMRRKLVLKGEALDWTQFGPLL